MISYTKLSNYRRCSLRRHLEQGLDLNLEDDQAREIPSLPVSGGLALGRLVHQLISEVDWHDRESIAKISQTTSNDRAREILAKLDGSEIRQRLGQAEIIAVESEFSLRLGRHLISGIIDLLARDEQGLILLDWKTGEDLTDFAENYRLQQSIYSIAILESEEFAGENIEAIWLALEQEKADTVSFGQGDLLPLKEATLLTIEEILQAPIAAAAQERQPFCSGCPGLSRICPVSR